MSELLEKTQDAVARASDPAFPPESSSPVPATNAQAASPNDSNAPVPDASRSGADFLATFLSAAPFIELFERHASSRFNDVKLPARVNKMKIEHPNFYLTCLVLDTIVRVLVVFSLLALAIVAAFKVLSPLPDFPGV